RIARLASGGRHGFAQSIFQVGGNAGTSLGPLLAAFIVVPRGQGSIAWFSLAGMLAIAFLWHVGTWYKRSGAIARRPKTAPVVHAAVSVADARKALVLLLLLVISKHLYLSSINSFYTFYLINRFAMSVQTAQ